MPKSKRSTKKTATKSTKSAAPSNKCLCGCNKAVKFSFAQGHDAKLRGALLRGEIKTPTTEQKAFAKSHGVKIGSKAKKEKAA